MSHNTNPTPTLEVEKKKAYSPVSWLALTLIIALCVVNLLLVKQNMTLRRQLATRTKTTGATANSLRGGEVLAGFVGIDLSGQPYTLDYKKDGRQHLLLFFSPSCPYCVQQAPLWRDMLNRLDRNRFDVVAVVGDKEDKAAVTTHVEELGYLKAKVPPSIVFLGQEALTRYKLVATPTTLLINDSGKVEHVWVGKWDEPKVNEVSLALK